MWIKKAWLFILRFKVGRFGIPLAVLPIRCFNEIFEGFGDILALFKPLTGKLLFGMDTVQLAFEEMQAYGKLDIVDIAVNGDGGPVNIRLLMR